MILLGKCVYLIYLSKSFKKDYRKITKRFNEYFDENAKTVEIASRLKTLPKGGIFGKLAKEYENKSNSEVNSMKQSFY